LQEKILRGSDIILEMKPQQELTDQFYKELLENLYDGVYFVDPERKITYWNKGAERISGYSRERVIGSHCYDNLLQHVTENGVQLCHSGCPLKATMDDGHPREAEIYLRHADGFRIPVQIRTSPIFDEKGEIVGAVEVFSNNQTLMKMKRRVSKLEQTVIYDPLTQIGNRKHIEIKIKSALQEYKHMHFPFGVLFIDIDHFKSVNDTFGHIIGDKVLRAVANTLRHSLRETDTCGRWGGEEFLALVFNLDNDTLKSIAEKLRSLVEQTVVTTETGKPKVTISIGATLVRNEDTLESLVYRADTLMYKSKSNGRNCVSIG
jgi:diguanylate cyclase (GGDEF)-like protein/PAS domain S-box-containing protein